MLSLLISLLILILMFAVIWWIISLIPVPPPFVWIVQVVVAVIFLIALIETLTGGFVFFPHTILRKKEKPPKWGPSLQFTRITLWAVSIVPFRNRFDYPTLEFPYQT